MKFIVSLLLTSLLAFISGLYFPWWSIALVGLLVALLVRQSAGRAFLAGFAGVFLLWVLLTMLIDNSNDHLLSSRVGQLMGIASPLLLSIITSIIGGLIGGLGALTGHFILVPARKSG